MLLESITNTFVRSNGYKKATRNNVRVTAKG